MDEHVSTWDWPLISDGARGEWLVDRTQSGGWMIRWVPREPVEPVLLGGCAPVQDPWDTW